mmetsp:Transcript_20752/g.57676  ORF Transcript_20752/g.57676 Transcript_20752/m.57676 type:complete len:219 (+) Transcript_20752:433-1089(+)
MIPITSPNGPYFGLLCFGPILLHSLDERIHHLVGILLHRIQLPEEVIHLDNLKPSLVQLALLVVRRMVQQLLGDVIRVQADDALQVAPVFSREQLQGAAPVLHVAHVQTIITEIRRIEGRQESTQTHIRVPFPDLPPRCHPSTLVVDVQKLLLVGTLCTRVVLVMSVGPVVGDVQFPIEIARPALQQHPIEELRSRRHAADAQRLDVGLPQHELIGSR